MAYGNSYKSTSDGSTPYGQIALATTTAAGTGHNKIWNKGGVFKTINTITC
jgi:hypothetical protein